MSQPLRVLHVLYCLRTGGIELLVGQIVRALGPPEFEHIICIVDTEGAADPGARIIEVEAAGHFLLPHFLGVFRRERPDVVNSYNWGTIEAVLAARIAGVPLVIHNEHGRNVESMDGDPWRRRLIRRTAYHAAHRLICVTEELKQHYYRQVGPVAKRFEVVPNGIDTECYRPDSATRADIRRQFGIGDDVFVIGTVGRLDPVKNHEALLRAAERLIQQGVNARIVIAGEGPRRGALNQLAAGSTWLRERVLFLGDRHDVPSVLNGFDVFALPSVSEGMSLTLLEAMATGLPVVASAVGGNPEVIENGISGLLFRSGEAETLADILGRLSRDVQQRSALGLVARERVRRQFSFTAMLARYKRLYSTALDGQKTLAHY